jgi:hypothetical protein
LESRDVPALLFTNDVLGRIYEVDTATGQSRTVGNTGLPLQDLAFDGSGRLYGVTTQGQLYSINPDTAATQYLGSAGVPLNSLDCGPDGRLYAATWNGTVGSTVYRFDLTLGQILEVGTTMGHWSAGDLAFAPDGTLFMSTRAGALVTVNLANAAAANQIGLLPTTDINGLSFGSDGQLYGLSASSRTVYRINTISGAGERLSTITSTPSSQIGAATRPAPRKTLIFLFCRPESTSTPGLKKLEQAIRNKFGGLVTTTLVPWTTATPGGLTPLQRGQALLTTALHNAKAGPRDRVVLIGHSLGGHLARLLASDVRVDQAGPQPASALVTLDPLDWTAAAATPNQSALTYPLPPGMTGSRVLNFVQRNNKEKYQGYSISGAKNDELLGRGADGVWSTADDTTHGLIDDNLSKNSQSLGIYQSILQFLDVLLRTTG